MKSSMHGFETLLIYVRVNLCGRDVRVAQHFLNDPEVGAIAEQMGGKTVPQKMRIDIGLHTGAFGMFLYDLPNASGGELSAPCRKKNLAPRCGSDKPWPLRREVSGERLGSLAAYRYQSHLIALADNTQNSFFVIELFQPRCS